MTDSKNYVTKQGLEHLKSELAEFKTVRRKEVSEKLQRAIAEGDLSENADYSEAKEEQAFIEGRIAELESAIGSAVVIHEHGNALSATLGSVVTVQESGGGKEKVFTLVGSEEADPEQNKISHLSPLGAAILGKRAGDEVQVSTPLGPTKWKIKAIK